MNISWV